MGDEGFGVGVGELEGEFVWGVEGVGGGDGGVGVESVEGCYGGLYIY